MAPQSDRIVSDPDTLGGQPRIQGRRISVLQIVDEVEGRGDQPHTVADRYDLSIADVYRALAYFHEHPQEMATARDERAQALESIKRTAAEPADVE